MASFTSKNAIFYSSIGILLCALVYNGLFFAYMPFPLINEAWHSDQCTATNCTVRECVDGSGSHHSVHPRYQVVPQNVTLHTCTMGNFRTKELSYNCGWMVEDEAKRVCRAAVADGFMCYYLGSNIQWSMTPEKPYLVGPTELAALKWPFFAVSLVFTICVVTYAIQQLMHLAYLRRLVSYGLINDGVETTYVNQHEQKPLLGG